MIKHRHAPGSKKLSTIDRRKFLTKAGLATAGTGALWVTPSVIGLDAAYAVSSCKVPTLTPWTSNTSLVTWQTGSGNLGPFAAGAAPSPYNTAPFDPSTAGGTPVPIYLVEQDPVAATYAYTTICASYTSSAFTLTAGSTFTFTFNIRWRDTQNHVATQQVAVQWARSTAGPWTTGYSLQTFLHAGNPRDILTDVTGANFSLPITAGNAGTYVLRYAFSFQGTIGTASTQRANDIAITLPTATCA